MIVREAPDGSALLILQEGHADVAAQLAAHWGNDVFARLDPYHSMLFATVYHDSGHREMEADVPIDAEKGLPYPFRGAPAAVRRRDADATNAQWIRSRDPYASLVVSTHHAGLRKDRYDTVRARRLISGSAGSQDRTLPAGDRSNAGSDAAFEDFEGWQQEVAEQLGLAVTRAREAFWHNYQLVQVFDLLSLYLCCDGYDGEHMVETTLEPVPLRYASEQKVDLRLVPIGSGGVRIAPYPFDVAPLTVSVMARRMAPRLGAPEDAAREAYYQAQRESLRWELTA